jgi:hypothetical protein
LVGRQAGDVNIRQRPAWCLAPFASLIRDGLLQFDQLGRNDFSGMRQGVLLDPGILGEPAANRGNDRVRIAAVELDAAFELP